MPTTAAATAVDEGNRWPARSGSRKATPTVIDATAGLGRDAFVTASLGARVVMLERSPVVGALLRDALRRAHADPVVSAIAARMQLVVTDAVTFLETLTTRPGKFHPDVVYLDPMYPHTNKTALQKRAAPLPDARRSGR